MRSQAASKLEYAVEASPRPAVRESVAEVPAPEGPSFFERAAAALKRYLLRKQPTAAGQFRWNVPVQQVCDVRPETVYCVELPVSDPVGVLSGYLRAGVAPDHVVFVGDPLTLNDAAYDAITRKGALVHETPKKGRQRQALQNLGAYYEAAETRPPRPLANPHPYSYNPGPPKVTPEQLQALVDAIGRRQR